MAAVLKGNKRVKVDAEVKEDEETHVESITDLGTFVAERTLRVEPRSKLAVVLGAFTGRKGQAILKLEKTSFDDDQVKTFASTDTSLALSFRNNIYHQFVGQPNPSLPVKVDIVYPCTQKHIDKETPRTSYMVAESPQLYQDVHKPYIEAEPIQRIQWVYNILEKKKEVERLLLEDTHPQLGFMLHPDLKWTQASTADLYCVLLVNRRDVRSIRDLSAEHLPLLQNVRTKCLNFIEEKFGLGPSSVRAYFHYVPSYYHLHIHFTNCNFEAPGVHAGRAHLLEDVIANLQTDGEFYRKRTLYMRLPESHGLYVKFQEQVKDSSAQ